MRAEHALMWICGIIVLAAVASFIGHMLGAQHREDDEGDDE